ncbi:MAG: hypothetical protein D6683_13795 [Actinomyces sp.]|nr:MAG: hypothetical protein D6683_13795 [Actinomyces sp.]
MPTLVDKTRERLETAGYTGAGVNLLVTEAVLGREVHLPGKLDERAEIARQHARDTLSDLRARTEPVTDRLVERLPDKVAETVAARRRALWERLGVPAPETAGETTDA